MKRDRRTSLKEINKKFIDKTFGLASNITEVVLLILSSLPYMVAEPSMNRVMENIAIIWDGYDPKRVRECVYGMKSRKFLDKNYQLTQQGWEKIKSLIPIYTKPQRWDGNWYLVVFDIPEYLRKKRDILRNKLTDLGFGMLQKSIWLSPYNYLEIIKKLVGYYHINDYVLTTITTNISNQDDRSLSRRVWHLDKINKEYKEFIEKYKEAKKTDISGRFLYFSILKKDPQLPTELLLEDWKGREAARIARRKKWVGCK